MFLLILMTGTTNNAPKPSIFGQPAGQTTTSPFGAFGQTQQQNQQQQPAQTGTGLFGNTGLFGQNNQQNQQQGQQQPATGGK